MKYISFFIIVFFVFFSTSVYAGACLGKKQIYGPDRVILGEENEFYTKGGVEELDSSSDKHDMAFFRSLSTFSLIGETSYSLNISNFSVEARLPITFDSTNDIGVKKFYASYVNTAGYVEEPFTHCREIIVQRSKPESAFTVENLTAVSGVIKGRIKILGSIDSNAVNSSPRYLIETRCWGPSQNWTKVKNNSLVNYYDFEKSCNFDVRYRVYDGFFYSSLKIHSVKFSDAELGNDTGPGSAACKAVCPLYLDSWSRSLCMRSNPVCHH